MGAAKKKTAAKPKTKTVKAGAAKSVKKKAAPKRTAKKTIAK